MIHAVSFVVAFLSTLGVEAENRFFWQVTDFHLDLNYTLSGDPNDRKMCHKQSGSPPASELGTFGNYHCDAPPSLVDGAIAGMAKIKPDPDFILWTGDEGPHVPMSELDTNKILGLISEITYGLMHHFPNTTFFPVLGNHDYYPSGAMPPNTNAVYDSVADYWSNASSHWLGSEETALFRKYGYYSKVFTPPGTNTQPIRMLGLNTIYYYTQDKLTKDLPDPAGQFHWMDAECSNARKNGEKVFVIAHVPPGEFERSRNTAWFYPNFNKKFIKFLQDNSDVISGRFFAHQHTDTFKVIRNGDDVASVLFLAPAVTPWNTSLSGVGPNNPGIRLYEYDPMTGLVVDIHQYWLNLTEANVKNETDWTLEYNARDAYNVRDVGGAEMLRLAKGFLSSRSEQFDKYYKYNSVSYSTDCDSECKTTQICAILCPDYDNYDGCLKDPDNVMAICVENEKNQIQIPLYGKVLIGIGGGLVVAIGIFTALKCAGRHKRKAYMYESREDTREPLLTSD